MPSYVDQAGTVKRQVANAGLFERRRDQIISAAVQLFSEHGYYRTTVQEIAERAGMSAGLVYQYVQDKETLLLLSILNVLDSYATEIPLAVRGVEGALERCCAAFRAYCRVVDRFREATVLAYRSTKSLPAEQRQIVKNAERETNELVEGYIRACVEKGLFRPVDSQLAAYQLVMYAHSWALKHWQFRKRFDLDAYIEQGLDLFLHAMLTEEGRKRLARRGGTPGPA